MILRHSVERSLGSSAASRLHGPGYPSRSPICATRSFRCCRRCRTTSRNGSSSGTSSTAKSCAISGQASTPTTGRFRREPVSVGRRTGTTSAATERSTFAAKARPHRHRSPSGWTPFGTRHRCARPLPGRPPCGTPARRSRSSFPVSTAFLRSSTECRVPLIACRPLELSGKTGQWPFPRRDPFTGPQKHALHIVVMKGMVALMLHR